jgi:predicted transcriptional regulator
VEDDERGGHPRSHRTNENVEKVWNLMHSDKCLNIRAVAMQLNLDKETVKKTLTLAPKTGFTIITVLQLTRNFLSSNL